MPMANFSKKGKLLRFPAGANENLMETFPVTELQADPVHLYAKTFFKGTFFVCLFVSLRRSKSVTVLVITSLLHTHWAVNWRKNVYKNNF